MSSISNESLLTRSVQHGWITPEQAEMATAATENEPGLDLLAWLTQQGWLGPEHVEWLRQADQASVLAAQDTTPRHEPAVQVAEDAVRVPADLDFEVHLDADGALVHLNEYLRIGQFYQASDVHLGVNCPPVMRRHGCLQVMWPKAPPFTAAQTHRLMMGFTTEPQKAQLKERGDLDFCYAVDGLGRFRTSVVRQRLGLDGVFRIINTQVRTMEELGLPETLRGLTKFHNGLILVTGAVGSGKSTTLAAFVDKVNTERRDHIITMEDPIEFVFEPKGCQITQREVHTHTKSFSTALRAALREDPDVIMVGEMRDLETIQLAITASETGHLVFATLHTSSAARTLDRILDVFPVEQQSQIRTMVAGSLRGIISQQLVPRLDGKGRALALEIMINNPAVQALIRDGKTFMLPGVIQTGKKLGCKLMDDSLMDLLEAGVISPQEAFDRASEKQRFKHLLEE
jgi:twitching motility protein PilT